MIEGSHITMHADSLVHVQHGAIFVNGAVAVLVFVFVVVGVVVVVAVVVFVVRGPVCS